MQIPRMMGEPLLSIAIQQPAHGRSGCHGVATAPLLLYSCSAGRAGRQWRIRRQPKCARGARRLATQPLR
eukprot:10123327-Karenia_brevis.AAC.1